MLDFVIFAFTFAVVLVAAVFYLYPGSRRVTTIPGLDPSDSKDGNLSDITTAGGIHPFLVDLHDKFGSIAGFWFGEQYVVSIASPELFKEHLKVFDRPAVLFKCLEPLVGSESIQFANGTDGRQRRKCYDRYFSSVACKNYIDKFEKIGLDMIRKWSSLPANEHIPLHQYMMALSLKSILSTAFDTTLSEKDIIQFHMLYELVFSDLCSKLIDSQLDANNTQEKRILKAIEDLHAIVQRAISERKLVKEKENEVFVDFLLNENLSEDQVISDAMSYIIAGFHTTGNLLTWALYYLAINQDIQEKLQIELDSFLADGDITDEKLSKLKYAQQIIEETMRISVLAPFASRYQDIDVEIGGHIIPKRTPIIHALGVVLKNSKFWSLPDKFDPDRFAPGKNKNQHPLSNCPFGFAGQRICPGKNFAITESLIYLSLFLRKFKIKLVDGQVVTPVHTLVTRPEDEVWITITHRKLCLNDSR